jgi:hypothetical protein
MTRSPFPLFPASARRTVVAGVVAAGCLTLAAAGMATGQETPPATGSGAASATLPPAWGTIDPLVAGCTRFHIATPPANGRLVVPPGFPQIVRAKLAGADGPRDLPVEFSADATAVAILLPRPLPDAAAGSANTGSATITIDTLDKTGQFDDGRIGLAALDATVEGTTARLESHPGNHRIGFWTDATDAVRWKLAATRWGMYDVRLTYSSAGPAGTEIAVDVGGTTLTGTLGSTGSWYRYATLPLGKVYLAQAGEHPIAVRCTKKAGDAVMNLKALSLEPACEGRPPMQAADGTVLLHGRDATVRGTMLRYEPAEKKQTLGFWVRPGDAAEWSFTVEAAGTFDVEVLQGCGPGNGGSTMRAAFDGGGAADRELSFVVEETTGFQDFKPRVIGRVTLAAGGHLLRVGPEKIAAKAACDIRQVRLVPVRDRP